MHRPGRQHPGQRRAIDDLDPVPVGRQPVAFDFGGAVLGGQQPAHALADRIGQGRQHRVAAPQPVVGLDLGLALARGGITARTRRRIGRPATVFRAFGRAPEALLFTGFPVVAFSGRRHYKTPSDLGPKGIPGQASSSRPGFAGLRRLLFENGLSTAFGRSGSVFTSRAGECPERQRGRTVNPLRKLRRFESCFPHHALSKTGTVRTSRRPVAKVRAPRGPRPTQSPCGYSTMVVQQPSKLNMSVRFRLPAPIF